jgi:hypothetical protein
VLRCEQRIAERRQEHFADELVHQPAAAAMREQDLRVLGDGNRAAGGKVHKDSEIKTSNIQRPTPNIE